MWRGLHSTPPASPMPLSDRTNVPSGTPAHHASLPCKDSLNHPRATLTLKLPKNDTELAQQLLQDPACLTRIELFYKNATPLFLLRTYLSLRCSYMDPSLQPTTSTNRKITLGFPRRQECYGTNLTSLPRSVPRIRFFKNGVPGPFLKELLEGPLINFIDDSDDVVVERNIEQKVYFQLDVSEAFIRLLAILLRVLLIILHL